MNPREFGDLIPSEQRIATKMIAKGYRYIAQLVTTEGYFGEPLYFKMLAEIEAMRQSFPAYREARVVWSFKL